MDQIISHYRVITKLGEGGMGTVYKAFDQRLHRFVALKILHSTSMLSHNGHAQFIHEARTASSLNHPNICIVYDIGVNRGLDYIVMEYVAGQSLRKCLDAGQLFSVEETLQMGMAICHALRAVHEQSIIHRDIKPDNIMLRPEGEIKIMDFGLAVLKQEGKQDFGRRPLTSWQDQAGTAQYMAPEQLDDMPIDERVDFFALGLLMYELLTGSHPFARADILSQLQAVLHDEPVFPEAVWRGAGSRLKPVLQQCLEKDRALRPQDAGQLLSMLESAWRPRKSRKARLATALVWMAIASVMGFGITLIERHYISPLEMTVRPLLFTEDIQNWPTFSPDGEELLYFSAGIYNKTGNSSIKKLHLSSGESSLFSANPRFHISAWSSDGRYVVLGGVNNCPLYLYSHKGDSLAQISTFGYEPRWSPSGTEIAFCSICQGADVLGQNRIYIYSLADSTVTQISPETGQNFADPAWLPDGAHLICAAGKGSRYELWLINARSREARPLSDWGRRVLSPKYCPRSRRVYFVYSVPVTKQRLLHYAHFDPTTLMLTSGPIPLLENEVAQFDLSSNGRTLVYTQGAASFEMKIFDVTRPQDFIENPVYILLKRNGDPEYFEVSPTGGAILLEMERVLWCIDMDTRTCDTLYNQLPVFAPTWSHDGLSLYFDSGGGDEAAIWRVPASGGSAEKVIDSPMADWLPSCAPDGRRLSLLSNRSGRFELWVHDLQTRTARQLTREPGIKSRGFWSHNSRHIAYLWAPGHHLPGEIRVVHVASGKTVTVAGVYESHYGPFHIIRWSQDDSRLYFFSAYYLYALDLASGVTTALERFNTNASAHLFDVHGDSAVIMDKKIKSQLWLAEHIQF